MSDGFALQDSGRDAFAPEAPMHGTACGCADCAAASTEAAGDGTSTLTGTKPIWSLDQVVSNYLRTGQSWQQSSTVFYSFREANPPGSTEAFVAFTATERQMTRMAFEQISDIVNLTFVEAPDDGLATGGRDRIYFAAASNLDASEWGHAQRWTIGSRITGAEVWISTNAVATRQWFPGGYNFQALVHEVIHTLGIPHPGAYNAGPGKTITYAENASYAQDSRQYTVMSYFDAEETGADYLADYASGRFSPATPMLHDIAGLQALYGANTSTRTGDTVYGYNNTSGRTSYDFAAVRPDGSPAPKIFTIWDAGGIDTIDFSQTPYVVNLDLREGMFSDAFQMVNNIAIAYGAIIENAIGGMAGDTLRGNDVANRLIGGAGADLMIGGGGDDVYEVTDVGDHVVEAPGEGTDTVFSHLHSYYLPNHVETLALAGAAVWGIGNAAANTLIGTAGNNVLAGGSGADVMIGGGGDDAYEVWDLGDVVIERAGEGSDTVFSYLFSYTLPEHAEVLSLEGAATWGVGNAADNVLYGHAGVNVLVGGAGADRMIGRGGNDNYEVTEAADVVVEIAGEGHDSVYSYIYGYTLPDAVEDLFLVGATAKVGIGNGQANRITGTDRGDALNGGGGDDVLIGGGGSDSFWFDAGRDRILDFRPGEDVLVLDDALFADFAAVQARMSQVGADVVITYDADTSVTLHNVQIGQIAPTDVFFF